MFVISMGQHNHREWGLSVFVTRGWNIHILCPVCVTINGSDSNMCVCVCVMCVCVMCVCQCACQRVCQCVCMKVLPHAHIQNASSQKKQICHLDTMSRCITFNLIKALLAEITNFMTDATMHIINCVATSTLDPLEMA